MHHSDQAIAVARETGWNLDEEATEREWAAIGIGPVGQHRDSDALARSNFAVVSADLMQRFPGRVDVCRFGHWAVGWVEELVWDRHLYDPTADAGLIGAVEDWREQLEDYPVADDEHYSALEYEEMLEYCDGLRWSEVDGLEVIVNPLAEEDFGARIAGLLECSRPDDAPGEEEIGRMALQASILLPDAEQLRRDFEDAEAAAETVRAALEDVSRGIADMEDVRRAAFPFVA